MNIIRFSPHTIIKRITLESLSTKMTKSEEKRLLEADISLMRKMLLLEITCL